MNRRAPLLLALLITACGGDGTLVLQVRSDLLPGADLASVEVRVTGADPASEQLFTVPATSAQDWGRGVRVVETPLAPGQYRARVIARDADGLAVVERGARFEIGGGVQVVTVLLTRDCQGVVCPALGDGPEMTACLAGRCVAEECTEESPDRCAGRVCSEDTQCGAATAGCATRECTPSGACVDVPDHGMCAAEGEVCSAAAGCVPASGGTFSPPGPGHALIVSLGPGSQTYRIALAPGAALEDLSGALDGPLPADGTIEDGSAGLSPDGEWFTLIGRRAGCTDCVVAGPVRSPSRAALVTGPGATSQSGSVVTEGAREVLYVEGGHLTRVDRTADGWSAPERIDTSSPHPFSHSPRLTPTGDVAFICGPDADVTLGGGICEVALDGTGFRERLAPGNLGARRIDAPATLLDGSVLFQVETGPGMIEIWRLPADGSAPSREPDPLGDSDNPCALRDGRVVAAEPGGLEVFAADGTREAFVSIDLPPEEFAFFVDSCGL